MALLYLCGLLAFPLKLVLNNDVYVIVRSKNYLQVTDANLFKLLNTLLLHISACFFAFSLQTSLFRRTGFLTFALPLPLDFPFGFTSAFDFLAFTFSAFGFFSLSPLDLCSSTVLLKYSNYRMLPAIFV